MPRDISLEVALLDILDLLAPTPMQERVLAREVEIRLDRQLTTAEYQEALKSLTERRLVGRGDNRFGLPQVWITEAGRTARRC